MLVGPPELILEWLARQLPTESRVDEMGPCLALAIFMAITAGVCGLVFGLVGLFLYGLTDQLPLAWAFDGALIGFVVAPLILALNSLLSD